MENRSSFTFKHVRTGVETSGKIYVECAFDGNSKDYILDTGAGLSVVSSDHFFENYQSVKQVSNRGASGHDRRSDVIQISQIKIGSYLVENHQVMRTSDGMSIHILGSSIFKDKNVKFDFDQNEVTFSADKLATSMPLQWLSGGQILIPVNINQIIMSAVFDTGADLTVVSRKFVAKNAELFERIKSIPNVNDASLNVVELDLYRIKSDLVIGGLKVSDGFVFAMPFESFKEAWGSEVEMILGYNHIVELNWHFDFEKHLWQSFQRRCP